MDTTVDKSQGGIKFEAHLTKQGSIAAQNGQLPTGAFPAQNISILSVQIAQVPAFVKAQAVGRIGNDPAGAGRRLDG